MKTIFYVIVFLISFQANAQNSFIDGIHKSNVVEYKDGDIRFSGSAFKVITTGSCHVSYQVNELWNDRNALTNYVTETNWNWQDVATIEVDTIKNIVRLNGRDPMPKKQKNVDTGEVLDDPNNNTVNIYYKTKDLAVDAGKWAFEQAKTCGAKVLMIN
jgi:hypothetical protein